MPSTKPPYPVEFRQQLVELIRAGRTPAELSREFGPSAQSIINWVAADSTPGLSANKPRGPATQGLSGAERDELARLRRENRQLKMERDILAKATAWFAAKGDKTSTGSSNS